MKKIIKLALGGLLACTLFSCAQPTDAPKVEEAKTNDFYFLYDSITTTDKENYKTTGYKLVSNITGKEDLKEPIAEATVDTTTLTRAVDFAYDKNKDLYVLLGSGKTIAEKIIPEKYEIIKYEYSDANNGEYSEPISIYTEEYDGGAENRKHYRSIAVNNGTIVLGSTYNNGEVVGARLNLLTKTENVYKRSTDYKLNDSEVNIVTAIEFAPNGDVILAMRGQTKGDGHNIINVITLRSFKISENGFMDKDNITEVNFTQAPFNFAETIKNYAITDLMYQEGSLYALVSLKLGIGTYIGGGIAKISYNDNAFVFNGFYGYESEGSNMADMESGEPTKYLKPTNTTPFFYAPKKFIAIKPKKLVIADEGFYVEDTNNSFKDTNSVVTVDLENGIPKITDRIIMEKIDFNASYISGASGFTVLDYDVD